MVRASLCAVLTQMEKSMTEKTFKQYIDSIDWKEAGVSKREFVEWWADHKLEDAMRRQREADPEKYRQRNAEGYLRHAEARKAAMRARYAAMTPEQRRLPSRRANRQRSAAQTHDGAPE